ncbi:(2Fe-2S)-binding protein [SAR202 cluster bacterium AD-493-K16_JPT_193m]|nr:(2Fe-2S)-binding protein [SAR202 cluster bacterium AD-493-K16_JPT_193m]
MPKIRVSFVVNQEPVEILVEPWQTLMDALREDLRLTGTKEGCGNGNCGACTVMLNDKAINSCCMLAAEAEGQNLTTVEGLANGEELDPLQKAFIDFGALQCGFCTPGFLVSARAFLNENPKPSEQDIRLAIAGNLCRCTGYDKIVRAIQHVAESSN